MFLAFSLINACSQAANRAIQGSVGVCLGYTVDSLLTDTFIRRTPL